MKKSYTIALVGNPNVGKSTVFNLLTGLKQHTGNWTGKTVSVAEGKRYYHETEYRFIDLPGTYSLFYNSEEERITSEYLVDSQCDISLIVCDATALERNLILALQTIEISKKCVLCLNMMDEAKKNNVLIDLKELSNILGIPVIGISARKKHAIDVIMSCLEESINTEYTANSISYVPAIEEALNETESKLKNYDKLFSRWLALNILENNQEISERYVETNDFDSSKVFERYGYDEKTVKEKISYSFVRQAHDISSIVLPKQYDGFGKFGKADRIITGKYTSIPIIALLLVVIFWITITASNYPSELLSSFFGKTEIYLSRLFLWLHIPSLLSDVIINGVYKVVTWVVSVMLPPMMIFFPLFTLLEDVGFLPRLAFNVDSFFQKCNACGKQALTYCMSFGCNAVGIVSSRIIDSKKEKIIAIVTNNFIPCNGRFPILISIISIFLIGTFTSRISSVLCAIVLALFIIISVLAAMLISKLLSKTLLKEEKTSYTLELPSFRKPQIGKIILRSILDRTVFVLGRAIAVAAPAGVIIWVLSSVKCNNIPLLIHISSFLDPFGKLFGMDGVIILAFILGLPANEIVIPIIVMCYMQSSYITRIENLSVLRELFISNGWTIITAICVILFTIMHWPCSTSIITAYKETKSIKWTLLSVLTPTACGLLFCFIINTISKMII